MNRIKIERKGAILINGHYRGFIDTSESGYARVILMEGHETFEAVTFHRYRPNMTARSWARYVLQRKSVRQIKNALKTKTGHEIAEKLGWMSPAVSEAEVDRRPFRYTGSIQKIFHDWC